MGDSIGAVSQFDTKSVTLVTKAGTVLCISVKEDARKGNQFLFFLFSLWFGFVVMHIASDSAANACEFSMIIVIMNICECPPHTGQRDLGWSGVLPKGIVSPEGRQTRCRRNERQIPRDCSGTYEDPWYGSSIRILIHI